MMGFVTDRMSEEEAGHLARLLYQYAETELDQFDNWRLDTAHGPVYVSMTRALLPGRSEQAFDRVPQPGTRPETGRFAAVSGVDQVVSRQDVQQVIAQMRADLAGRGWQEWENPALDKFLEAFEALVDGLPARLARQRKTETAQPDWAVLAQLLVAATGYE
jgi:hypothetical protein